MSELQAEWEKIRRQAWERQLRGHLHGRPPHDEDACEQLPADEDAAQIAENAEEDVWDSN